MLLLVSTLRVLPHEDRKLAEKILSSVLLSGMPLAMNISVRGTVTENV